MGYDERVVTAVEKVLDEYIETWKRRESALEGKGKYRLEVCVPDLCVEVQSVRELYEKKSSILKNIINFINSMNEVKEVSLYAGAIISGSWKSSGKSGSKAEIPDFLKSDLCEVDKVLEKLKGTELDELSDQVYNLFMSLMVMKRTGMFPWGSLPSKDYEDMKTSLRQGNVVLYSFSYLRRCFSIFTLVLLMFIERNDNEASPLKLSENVIGWRSSGKSSSYAVAWWGPPLLCFDALGGWRGCVELQKKLIDTRTLLYFLDSSLSGMSAKPIKKVRLEGSEMKNKLQELRESIVECLHKAPTRGTNVDWEEIINEIIKGDHNG